MEGFCVGVLGMSISDYMNAELRTIVNALNQYYELEEERQRQYWERTRWQTAALVNIQLSKKDKIKVFDLLPLPWDDEIQRTTAKPMSYDEQKAAFEKIDAMMKSRKAAK